MKLTVFILLITFVHVTANVYSQQTKLSVSLKNATVKEVLKEIEEQSDFFFLYKNEEIDVNRIVSVDMKDKALNELLDQIFVGTQVSYEIIDRQIILRSNFARQSQQVQTVAGKVTDSSGSSLPGVTVLVKGTTKGTITDSEGSYTIGNVSSNANLIFSFIGMKSLEIAVSGRPFINVSLEEEMIGVDEVVVTAFGISREKKQLSYATQQVDGEQLGATGNNNVVKSLQGKVAGVTVMQLSGAPGSEAKVTIRGSNSINGSNTPLYVVDGFPIEGGFNVDPNEIESMSVLKGATAAALYGLRASNGVILISTKRGKGLTKNKPLVTLNSNYSFDRLSVYPETQMIYAQGENVFQPNSAFSWGPKISEMGTYINQLGEEEVARAYDNAKEFFGTGGTLNSNINISNNFDKGNYSIGIGYSGQDGIIRNTDFERVSVKFAGDYQLSDKIKVGTLFNYATSKTRGTNQEGGNSSLFYAAFGAPPSYNLKGKPTHVEGNEYQQINYRGSHDNIYWATEHNRQETTSSSLISSVDFSYNPTNWLSLTYRAGIDEQVGQGLSVFELGSGATGGRTNPPSGGRLGVSMHKRTGINSTFIASIQKNLTDKLDFDVMVGHEFYDYNRKTLSTTGTDFTIGGFHELSNTSSITSDESWDRRRSYAFFGNLNMAYDNMLFLTVTGRNDVVSNMPSTDRSFFYPSVGMGFIFTEAMENNPRLLSFGKVRASYAEVGQAGGTFATVTTYAPGSANDFPFPFNGINAFTLSNSLKSTDLKPENTKSWEIGLNLGFIENRINLDYTYYDSKSEGQIFSVPISASTGFNTETRNAGEMSNKGHEIILDIKPIVSDDFSWNFTTNFTTYTNKVLKLAEGIDRLTLGSAGDGVSSVAEVGKEYPMLRGNGYARDPETGRIVVDNRPALPNGSANASYGMPLRSTGEVEYGKATPDFEVNFLNTFTYKNLTLFAQIDWRQGGKIYSGDTRLTKLYGTHYDTQFREDDYVEKALKGYFDNDGNIIIEGENDIVIKRGYQYYRNVGDAIRETSIYDASFIRLREVRLNYDIPVGFLKRYFISGASVYAVGRNLWLIKSGLPHFDPEMGNTANNNIGGTYTDYPQISSYGFGINLKF